MRTRFQSRRLAWWVMLAALLLTITIYAPGLRGGYLFDDYPNIIDNHGVQPADASLPSLINAALSSPSSEFKRPLASLTFAANYLISGLNPFGMKVTNLVIHLLNGLLVFLLARLVFRIANSNNSTDRAAGKDTHNKDLLAAIISASWMVLPINLTAVLYVVQRMESLANLFVLLGLLGYLAGRHQMLGQSATNRRGVVISTISVLGGTAVGLLAKETAVMLPLYAGLAEWMLFGFRKANGKTDRFVVSFYVVVLLLPLCIGLVWLLPNLLQPAAWATRDFTLKTRLLSEARIVCDYIAWSLLPTPNALSFYHDHFGISQSLASPWTTTACIALLSSMLISACLLRKRQPVAALGIFWFLGAHLLTATILPLELVYEHRNYFASFGLLLAIVPTWAAITRGDSSSSTLMALPRRALLVGLFVLWSGQTLITAEAWSNPLSLAEELAARAPASPRAQYELGRTYIIYSHYDPSSRFTQLAYAPLERSAALPNSSILAEQALIFMNSRMHLPLKDAWWDSLTVKLKTRRPTVEDESSLGALTQCAREHLCDLSKQRMIDAFLAALSHTDPRARLLAMYGDYAWNVLEDRSLALRMTQDAVTAQPGEPAYRITYIRMLIAMNKRAEADNALLDLRSFNIGGQLDGTLVDLKSLMTNTSH